MPSALPAEVPLALHARYSRAEVIAALGFGDGVKPKVTQGGILWMPEARCDVFFVDLRKAERDYSPTTMYHDYAINRELFHGNHNRAKPRTNRRCSATSTTRPRDRACCSSFANVKRSSSAHKPFSFLGPVSYVDHRSERPVAFTWRLSVPMPEELFEIARSVAAA